MDGYRPSDMKEYMLHCCMDFEYLPTPMRLCFNWLLFICFRIFCFFFFLLVR